MYLEERVPTYLEELKERYQCEEIDCSQISKNRKFIYSRRGGAKKVIKELNEQIDIDFVKESNLIENIEDVNVAAFLADDETMITHEYKQKRVLPKLDSRTMAKEAVAGCVIMATNPILGVLQFSTKHLEAFKYTLAEARQSQLKRKDSGEFGELTHDIITNINEMIQPGEYLVASSYRNEFSWGSCHVTGAKWTPVANSKVPARMEALLQWYNGETKMDPITKAAILHCEFISIHPFCDGNGRTARLLVNYELARHKLPTVVIKAKDKKAYYAALEKGITTGDVTDVAEMIKQSVLESQSKQIKAIERVQKSQNKNHVIK